MERRGTTSGGYKSFSASTGETDGVPWANLECSLLLDRAGAPANSEHLPYRCMLLGYPITPPSGSSVANAVLDGPCSGGSQNNFTSRWITNSTTYSTATG